MDGELVGAGSLWLQLIAKQSTFYTMGQKQCFLFHFFWFHKNEDFFLVEKVHFTLKTKLEIQEKGKVHFSQVFLSKRAAK